MPQAKKILDNIIDKMLRSLVSFFVVLAVIPVYIVDITVSTPPSSGSNRGVCHVFVKIQFQLVRSIHRQMRSFTGMCSRLNCDKHSSDPVIRELCNKSTQAQISHDWCPLLVHAISRLSAHYYENRNPNYDTRTFAVLLLFDDFICPGYPVPTYQYTGTSFGTLFCFAQLAIKKECHL
ncbi:uncharacterized protein [Apostichopus japonicus]|uniref:uncharacterized protein n=1 Tax=Stichopus japonicus TaxID=307972 RepID=UPI003AB59D10